MFKLEEETLLFGRPFVSSGHKLLRALDGQQMMAERLVFGILIDG
jgi:hypothetical protein